MFILHFDHFFRRSKLQKIRSIRIINRLLLRTKNNTNHNQTRHTPSDSSITSLSSLSSFRLSSPSIPSFHWLDCVIQGLRLSTCEYTSGWDPQKTTCILERWVRNFNPPRKLKEYAAIYHLPPNYNPSLLCYRYCLIKWYWYLLSI